jgi:hypothetical protein
VVLVLWGGGFGTLGCGVGLCAAGGDTKRFWMMMVMMMMMMMMMAWALSPVISAGLNGCCWNGNGGTWQ